MDAAILGSLEFTASANCEMDGDEITARNTSISVFIPGGAGPGRHCDITHLISEDELDTISEKIMAAYLARKKPGDTDTSLYN